MDRCPEAKAAELQQQWKRPNSCRQASSVRPGASSIPVQVASAVDRLPESRHGHGLWAAHPQKPRLPSIHLWLKWVLRIPDFSTEKFIRRRASVLAHSGWLGW